LLGDKFVDIEEKYDLNKDAEGFGEEGDGESSDDGGFGEEAGSEEQNEDF
jgi:hypothetical protein